MLWIDNYRNVSGAVSMGSIPTGKAAVEQTLLDLRGNIPTSCTSGRQDTRRECAETDRARGGAFYVMDREYIDFERLFVLTLSATFFVMRAKSNVVETPLLASGEQEHRRALRLNDNSSSFESPRYIPMHYDE